MVIGNIRPSMTIVFEGELYTVMECEHAKIARGSAFCRVKLKNMRTSQVLDRTLRDSDNVDEAFIEKRDLQYSYKDGDMYHFMDLQTFEDLILNKERIADELIWLKDNMELKGVFYNNELINLEVPLSLVLEVVETDPGFRGNTVKAGTKPAKLETGLVIQVPLFINIGDKIKVDTRKKEYLERA